MLLAILAAALLSLLNCTSPQAIANASANGAIAGRDAGQKAGEAAGFSAAFPRARDSSYTDTLRSLYAIGEFRRLPVFTAIAVGGGLLAGFIVQYVVLYFARRWGMFTDIDRIVLPRHFTQANLEYFDSSDQRRRSHIGIWAPFILATSLFLTNGCNEEEKAWKQAYDANYAAAYQEGSRTGELRGRVQGGTVGDVKAREAAHSGQAWQLYLQLSLSGLVAGVVMGLSLQYVILFRCRRSGRFDQLTM
ncbi:MAG: hypothetical protein ACRD3J_00600, partial [Thermoanaerobaculia bacterium]